MDDITNRQTEDLSNSIEKLSRLDIEWVSFIALRDAVAVGLRDVNLATRNETLRLAEEIMPKIFDRYEGLLKQKWESREFRECQEEAAITKKPFDTVVLSKIKFFDSLISQATVKDEISTLVGKRDSYQKLLKDDGDRKSFYEGKIILRDASIGATKQSDEFDVFDFKLPAGRHMRIRVTHETATENINGSDLIYEHHSGKSDMIRIAAIQYKLVDKGKILAKDKRVEKQINRLHRCFCEEMPCQIEQESSVKTNFRFPTCTAFVKVANRLQSKDAAGLSVGYYVPVCNVKEIWSQGKNLNQENTDGQIVTHRTFEDLFNAGTIGSRWLSSAEVEELYRKHKLIGEKDKVTMHIQLFE
jgi:hypothetical protein